MTTYSNSFEATPKKSFSEEYESQFLPRDDPSSPPTHTDDAPLPVSAKAKSDGILSKAMDIFRGLEIDDLLLIAVGILLLLDSDEDNDVIVIFIAIMLFF